MNTATVSVSYTRSAVYQVPSCSVLKYSVVVPAQPWAFGATETASLKLLGVPVLSKKIENGKQLDSTRFCRADIAVSVLKITLMQNLEVEIEAGESTVTMLPAVPKSRAFVKVPAAIVPGPGTMVQSVTVAGILPSGFATFTEPSE